MATDDDKNKLGKLLQGLEIPEVRLPERCSELVKSFHEKYDQELEEEVTMEMEDLVDENPFVLPKELLEETEQKLKELLRQNKRAEKKQSTEINKKASETDLKRPWRTNSNKEKLFRINNELKQHQDKAALCVSPLEDGVMKDLIKDCVEEGCAAPAVAAEKLRDVIDSAKKNLPNFLYKKINNSTATAILPDAHNERKDALVAATNANTESLLPPVTC